MPPTRLFSLYYVLAMFGAFIAFMPLGALILPQKIAMIAGIADDGGPVRALSWLLVLGGVAAGLGNIAAGHVSDRLFQARNSRRQMIGIGLATVVAALAAVGAAQSFGGLMLAMLAFQLALNILLAPLVALTVDYVPDRQKGAMAGWLGLALPAGSLAVTALVAVGAAARVGLHGQLALTGLMVILLVAPLLWRWPVPDRIAHGAARSAEGADAIGAPGLIGNFVLLWTARLLVQFAGAAILPYLYFYVADIARLGANPEAIAQGVGILALAFALASIAGAPGAGWLSDRLDRRQPVLVVTAGAVAAAMLLLATAASWPLIVCAYALFAAGLAGFLAVDSALVAQMVSASERRATLLGVMNLTNTLPGIMAPAATLMLIGNGVGTGGMLMVLKLGAAGAALAALCCSQIRAQAR